MGMEGCGAEEEAEDSGGCGETGSGASGGEDGHGLILPNSRLLCGRRVAGGVSEGFEEALELGREGGFEVHGLAGLRVGEGEMRGVEEVAIERERCVRVCRVGDVVGRAVEVVAYDGVAEGLQVDADLVGAAGLDLDLD